MRILQLCPKPPIPSVDGGCIAMNNITQGFLSNHIEIKLLTISTHKHPLKTELLGQEYLNQTKIEGVFVDTKLNIVDAFSNLVTSDSYNISRFFSPDFNMLLRETLEQNQFDIIHLESLFMTPYIGTIRQNTDAKIVLRSHNLEYMIWERLASATTNRPKKIYLNILAKQLKKYEVNILEEIDGVAAISKEDLRKYELLGCKKPVVTIPFGIDAKKYNAVIKSYPTNVVKLFHIGAMNWNPNIEGISWFMEEVWPEILKSGIQSELHLAGRDMPNWLFDHEYDFVVNHGEVESAHQFMHENDIMIVPLLSAGGMRVKIIEGMGLGKVVITTKIGAEGIDYTEGENILIANTKKEFVKKLAWLKDNPDQFKKISENAVNLVNEYYNNDSITSRLIDFYKTLT